MLKGKYILTESVVDDWKQRIEDPVLTVLEWDMLLVIYNPY